MYSEPRQLSVSPDNWNYSFNVSILAVDDFYNGVNLSLYILPSIIYSSDTDYMDLELDWISLTKLDDPFDEVDLASVGVSINQSFEMSVATSVYQKYTSQVGGVVELVMTRSSKPTGYVVYWVTTDNPLFEVMASPSLTQFNPFDYNHFHFVRIMSR